MRDKAFMSVVAPVVIMLALFMVAGCNHYKGGTAGSSVITQEGYLPTGEGVHATTADVDTPKLSGDLENGWRVVSVSMENGAFKPAQIVVNQGDSVRITIKSLDVEHGFTIGDYGVDQRVSAQPVVVEFKADKPGVHPFACNLNCGAGQPATGRLIVVPVSREPGAETLTP